ncbi:hypothetical protein TWF506_006050 [Arthrobotrys conoides]|uniref:Uncharacterized protein n=1 Tax=Arthrobotrys conoides TaxID=74498 RepID=A0AAN8NLF0_9PEZI
MHIKIAILSVLAASAAARTPFPRSSSTTTTIPRYPGRCTPATITKIVSQKCPIAPITKTVTQTTTVTKVIDPAPQTEEVEVEEPPTPSTTTKIGPNIPELPSCPPSTTVKGTRSCIQNAPPCPTERRCARADMNFNLTYDCACVGAKKQVTTMIFDSVCKGDCGCTPTITWSAKGPCATAPKEEKPGGKGGEEVVDTVDPPEEEEVDDAEGGY